MQQLVFLFIALAFLSILLAMAYKSRQSMFATLFAMSLLTFLAFYLFQFGNLGIFSIKALSAEAQFIKEKKDEVTQDAKEIGLMKDQIQSLLQTSIKSQKEIEQSKKKILTLGKEVSETSKLAQPPSLILGLHEIKKDTSGYIVKMQFFSSKNESLGILIFTASILGESDAKIINFWPSIGAFSHGPDSKKIQQNGKKARLAYSPMSAGNPSIELTLSNKAKVQIEGNYIAKPIILNVE